MKVTQRQLLAVCLLFVSFNLFAYEKIGEITWEYRDYGRRLLDNKHELELHLYTTVPIELWNYRGENSWEDYYDSYDTVRNIASSPKKIREFYAEGRRFERISPSSLFITYGYELSDNNWDWIRHWIPFSNSNVSPNIRERFRNSPVNENSNIKHKVELLVRALNLIHAQTYTWEQGWDFDSEELNYSHGGAGLYDENGEHYYGFKATYYIFRDTVGY
jgi:hypothetical protein